MLAVCADGFTGQNCIDTCDDTFYGRLCTFRCNCTKENCHHIYGCETGTCIINRKSFILNSNFILTILPKDLIKIYF